MSVVSRASLGAFLMLCAATSAEAQLSPSARRPAPQRTEIVRYEVLWRTEFLEHPSPTAPVIAWLDSGRVLVPATPEKYETGHARIIVDGRQGWVDNGYIRRIVTLRETTRLVDTVHRTGPRVPARRPGDPRAPDRVSPSRP